MRGTTNCRRCGADWSNPTNLEEASRAAFVKLVRDRKTIQAIKLLRDHTGLGLGDAKAILCHVGDVPGSCHRCKSGLVSEQSECPQCGSWNYDWRPEGE
jgi:hypothetical protein